MKKSGEKAGPSRVAEVKKTSAEAESCVRSVASYEGRSHHYRSASVIQTREGGFDCSYAHIL